MPISLKATPSSFRQPTQTVRELPNLRSSKGGARANSYNSLGSSIMNAAARAHSLQKSRFARMPHEPEDARLTGVTRSLARRLLALNITGTLRPMLAGANVL
jgi:hypothetical protein